MSAQRRDDTAGGLRVRCAVRRATARRPRVWTAGPESELPRQRGHGGDGAGPPQRRTGVPRRRREGIARRAVHRVDPARASLGGSRTARTEY